MPEKLNLAEIAEQSKTIKLPITESHHLPGEMYTSEDVFDLEINNIFKKEWFPVLREEQIPNVGDYKTFHMFGEAILITRDKTGAIQAFSNSCRHRGVEVAFRSGNRKNFMCPYHGWIYGLDGFLVNAPMMDVEAAGLQNCRLPTINVDTWGGFIFINLDPNAGSLQEEISEDLAKLDFLQPDNCRIVSIQDFEVDCNWKLLIENLMDGYHVNVLHTNTFGADFDPSLLRFELLNKGANYAVYPNGTLTPDGNSLFGNMPWLKESSKHFGNSLVLPPNAVFFGRCDMMNVFYATPVSADKSILTMIFMMPEQVLTDPELDSKVKVYTDYGKKIFDEDGEMLVSIQRNFSMDTYKPGPMNGYEEGIRHYLSAHVDRVFEPEGLTHETAREPAEVAG